MRARLTSLPEGIGARAQPLLSAAVEIAREQDVELWLVGGAVRDVALARPLNDVDLALHGDVERFARACGTALDAAVEVEARFDTASIRTGDLRIDVARLRTETYARPGALPLVRATDSLELDLARRDFTVNAIAVGLHGHGAGEVVDPHDGLRDLAAGTLRVLHARSFEDDATRIWRGARTAVLAKLRPDPETARLIEDGVRWLDTISGERLWTELALTAHRGRAGRVLELLDDWRAFPAIHPALQLHDATRRALRHRPGALPPARLAALLIAPIDDPRAVLERFAVDRATRDTVLDTRRLLDAGETLDDLARLEGVRAEARIAARLLAPETQPALQRGLARWERTRSPLTATELLRMGVPRGIETGRTLDRLRRARFLGTLRTPAQARAAVREMLDARSGDDDRGEGGQEAP